MGEVKGQAGYQGPPDLRSISGVPLSGDGLLRELIYEIRALRAELAGGEVVTESVEETVETTTTVEAIDLEEMTVAQLKDLAAQMGLNVPSKIRRDDLIALIEAEAE